jgi:hypothetical protein
MVHPCHISSLMAMLSLASAQSEFGSPLELNPPIDETLCPPKNPPMPTDHCTFWIVGSTDEIDHKSENWVRELRILDNTCKPLGKENIGFQGHYSFKPEKLKSAVEFYLEDDNFDRERPHGGFWYAGTHYSLEIAYCKVCNPGIDKRWHGYCCRVTFPCAAATPSGQRCLPLGPS